MSGRLAQVLAQLGSDETKVAQHLDRAGIVGHRLSNSACPIANYVRMFEPECFDVLVTTEAVSVWSDEESGPAVIASSLAPLPVSSFISSFDRGRYPQLDAGLSSLGGARFNVVLRSGLASPADVSPPNHPAEPADRGVAGAALLGV